MKDDGESEGQCNGTTGDLFLGQPGVRGLTDVVCVVLSLVVAQCSKLRSCLS